jgi:hypothetical protein
MMTANAVGELTRFIASPAPPHSVRQLQIPYFEVLRLVRCVLIPTGWLPNPTAFKVREPQTRLEGRRRLPRLLLRAPEGREGPAENLNLKSGAKGGGTPMTPSHRRLVEEATMRTERLTEEPSPSSCAF